MIEKLLRVLKTDKKNKLHFYYFNKSLFKSSNLFLKILEDDFRKESKRKVNIKKPASCIVRLVAYCINSPCCIICLH